MQDEVEITVIATGFPGYENSQTEEQQRAYTSGQLYTQQSYSQNRMSVNEPYYPQQRERSAPVVRPAVQEPQVERPSDKTVPKFAQLLHRFNRRNDDE